MGWGRDNKSSLCSATWSFCHTSCYAAWSCLMPDAPLLDLSVTCHGVGWGGDNNKRSLCSATWSFCHTSCCAAWSCLMPDAPLLDLSVTRHATLHDLVLCLMLRYLIFLSHVCVKTILWNTLRALTEKNNLFAESVDMETKFWKCIQAPLIPAGVCWKKIPTQLTTCPQNQGGLNHLIWKYVRIWQWRWENSTCWICSVEKNRHPLVQDVKATVCDC